MGELPEPLLPADVDLRDFEFMPLMVRRFRDSAIVATRSPEEVLAAIMLWCASWHQVPAASLPADDKELAQLAGYGRGVTDFQRIKEGAMHGLMRCSDGRYWHPVVAEQAADSWNSKLDQRHRKACDRMRKFNREREARKEEPLPLPDRGPRLMPSTSAGITRYFLVGPDGIPEDGRRNSIGRAAGIRGLRDRDRDRDSKGTGTGIKKKERASPASRLAPQGVQQETWDAWLKRKGKAQTEDADRLQRKRLGEWLEAGFDVNRIVEDAIANNWQGLHAPDRRVPVKPRQGGFLSAAGMDAAENARRWLEAEEAKDAPH